MPRDLLFEIGTEELPASFARAAMEAMPGLAAKLLSEARLAHGAIRAYGTPRRLALIVSAVAEVQQDMDESIVGPPRSVAMDASGKLSQAGLGFVRKLGVSEEAVTVVETEKGEYLSVRRRIEGKPAADVVAQVFGALAKQIPFSKSMRWGALPQAFGRPVHWVVLLFGEEGIPMQFAGVESGLTTRGHRFLAPQAVEITQPAAYLETLRRAHVLADADERMRTMQAQLERTAGQLGGRVVEDDFLLGECLFLVEEPHVIAGNFDETFLDLPEEVTISVMRNHQRYFALRSVDGALLPRYLNVVNTAGDPETIARGNDRVLRARLADARFFVLEDRKRKLSDRVSELDGIVFQSKLGTVRDKAERLVALQGALLQGDRQQAERAALLCKADLVTHIVGEFPELQGSMGRHYALEDGENAVVAAAIEEHYWPRGAGDTLPTTEVGAAVALADRMDTLVGCFGIGLVPTGSQDPYALRRAALGAIRIALEGPLDLPLASTIDAAHALYKKDLRSLPEVAQALADFFRARLRAHFSERFPVDVIDAALGAWDGSSLRDAAARVRALAQFRERPEFDSLATSFKRASKLTRDVAEGLRVEKLDRELLNEEAEKALAEQCFALQPVVARAIGQQRYLEALEELAQRLGAPIDRFFNEVFVMVDDPALRANRLRLLTMVAELPSQIAHFHLLS